MTTAMLKCRPHLIPCLCAAGLLVAALAKWPYAYFTLLRWAVCAVAVFVGYNSYRWRALWGAWVFGFITLFFNPLIPVHLSREIWQPIDLAAAAAFLAAAVLLRRPEAPKAEKGDLP